ncbi:synaptonemal complex protein 2-like isoform X2 [Dendrobates tinctorius]|uniref:synaptonemal complex protein 2-like isoform X2 n=1 Tax=Dendrobates tinctorius TaxID=92724 RepID=UPI003CC9E8EF
MSGEEKLNPSEKMNIQTEYYLEMLLIDAFKGKGFQEIGALFEHKGIYSPQRYSKVLLNQLDRLINKELDRNDFQNVSLVMKCIQHFCKSECHDGSSLIKQGLVSKMVLWFERTLEFLKICKDNRATISALIEDFYDTAMVICKCTSDDGIKQLLDKFLFTLGIVIVEKWPPYHVKLEALRTLNAILDQTLKEDKKKLNSSEEMCTLMQGLARKLFEVGDYEIQVAITEVLFRITTKKIRDKVAQEWFEDSLFAEAFTAITEEDFETDCRNFLIFFNSRLSDAIRVHSFPCISVSTDIGELTKPQDDKLEHFWIDFNVCSQGISFYTCNNEGCLWETVRLQKESLNGYSLEECNGQKLLSIHLKVPQSINNKEAKYIKMNFEMKHAIQNATIKTYGADLQMNVHLTSPEQTDTAINLQDGWKDSGKDSICEDPVPVSVSDTCRVLENTADKLLSEVLSTRSERFIKNRTSTETKRPQSAEKKAFDVFEFKSSSESASDIEMSAATVKIVSPPSSRKTTAPNKPRTRSSQKTKPKMAVNYRESSPSGSDISWLLESSRKSLEKSVDYSRKRQKSKILPLSSHSSEDEKKPLKMGEWSKVKEIKKEKWQKRGVAESLSFPEVKLPGVSALLTPSNSHPQTSGTLHLSDLDQDTMDPLVDDSSDEELVANQSDTASKMDIGSNEDQIELIKELHLSGKAGDSKKRKRASNEKPENTLKPRKLFTSGNPSADLEDEVFHSDICESDMTECSFIPSFERFSTNLKKTLMASYKKMEVRAQDGLKISHQHVSTLLNQIQQSNLRKLDNFHTMVAHHVSCLQAQTKALKKLEKESMDFWEAQTKKINEFCINQRLSIEAMEHAATESLNLLRKTEEKSIDAVKESLQKL